MPITLFDKEGKPVEVPTPEEVEALKKAPEEFKQKVEELEKEKLGLEAEKKQLEADVNPNWRAYREKEKRYKEALKAAGKEVDDDGNIIEKKEINKDEILNETRQIIHEETFVSEKDRLLAGYSDDEKKTIGVYLDKLMSGEEKNVSNLHKYFTEAVNFVFPNRGDDKKRIAFAPNGSGPITSIAGKPTESAVKMGEQFGISAQDHETKADPVIKL